MVALGELLALPVAIFTTTHLGIHNSENKILIWWPQLTKELTVGESGDGYKYYYQTYYQKPHNEALYQYFIFWVVLR